ncbi:MAG: hypothetical protein IV090_18070 [Candidatus Sericytochromatia bacterium]|nr:hypothetical protein [Candidatus Sericytochromatia bacterium]
MSDRDSFIQPFKNRLFEIFNASSSGQDPYRQSTYQRQQRRKKGSKPEDGEDWEQESQLFFDDFISLDEEKITHGLNRAQVRKAFDRKFRTSTRSDELAREMEIIEDTFGTQGISPETTAAKLEKLAGFLADFEQLIRSRAPSVASRFQLFSLPTLRRLKEWGMQAKMLQNLVWLRIIHRMQQEVLDNPEAFLHVQLCLQALDLPMRHMELQRFIERHLIDQSSFEALLHQTYHYLEQNARIFEAMENEMRLLSMQVQPWFLHLIGRPYLNLEKRLGKRHLENRYLRLKNQLLEVQRQIKHLEKSQSTLSHFLGEKADLLQAWQGLEGHLSSLLQLHEFGKSKPEVLGDEKAEILLRLGISDSTPNSEEGLFQLEYLVQLLAQLQNRDFFDSPERPDVYVAPLTLRQLQSIKSQDLAALEKWAIFKVQQVLLLQNDTLRPTFLACQQAQLPSK